MLRISHFISSALVVAVLAGGIPSWGCTPAVCAASTACATAHCSCCGPDCPMAKSAQESHRSGAPCNQKCPRVTDAKAIAVPHNYRVRLLASAMLGVHEVQPFLIAGTVLLATPFCQLDTLSPPTLLGLGCALTI
jgi:hypothetical protein